jgi:galactokinase
MSIRYAAPGRINLMGEHTDYNLGFALPIALPQRTTVAFTVELAEAITVASEHTGESVAIPLDTVCGAVTGWAAYAAGVIWALRDAGYPVAGGTMTISGDVPVGSGLASSAALECAVLGAIATATGTPIERIEAARLAQRAENDYVGAPTGLLDQLASLFGEPATALFIDFRDTTVHPVVFDPAAVGAALLVIDSRAQHRHVGGEYAARRRSCERAAADLGAPTLRDVQHRGVPALENVTDPIDARRARHVLTENQRVVDLVGALQNSDIHAAGRILNASHESMRDDFGVSTAHIDLIAEAAVSAGALGARMTGGGFGGCVIALVADERADSVGDAVCRAVTGAGYARPVVRRTRAAGGAGLR